MDRAIEMLNQYITTYMIEYKDNLDIRKNDLSDNDIKTWDNAVLMLANLFTGVGTDREKRFCELDTEIESWSEDEKNFVLWQLLKDCADRLEFPKEVNTKEDFYKERYNQRLWNDCKELVDMLEFALWR